MRIYRQDLAHYFAWQALRIRNDFWGPGRHFAAVFRPSGKSVFWIREGFSRRRRSVL